MPTPATSKWPRPKSEDEWEDMVLDALRIYWRAPFAQRNGRRGQRQHGVDIFGTSHGEPVGAQAKNSDSVDLSTVLDEITKAERFEPPLARYFLVVAGPRDAVLQEEIRILSHTRVARGEFAIELLSFDDVCMALSSDPSLIPKYWGAFLGDIESVVRALPQALSGPIVDARTALTRVVDMPEFRAFARTLDELSGGTVHAHARLDDCPQLDAERGTIERAWQVSIGESHETHVAMLCHVAVDFDTGAIAVLDVVTESWLPYEEAGHLIP